MSDQHLSAPNNSFQEDWDRSLDWDSKTSMQTTQSLLQPVSTDPTTHRNSVTFPAVKGPTDSLPHRTSDSDCSRPQPVQGKRTLSELLKLHAEKGTDCQMSQEEATRLGDVLGQWINASSSPYEGEDEFFKHHDDIDLPRRVPICVVRPRGQSECTGPSRTSSAAGFSMA